MRGKRAAFVLSAVTIASLAMAGPASAHVLVVETRGGEVVKEGWVGGFHSFAPHSHGLVIACGATGDNGSAVTIFAPWNADENICKHSGE